MTHEGGKKRREPYSPEEGQREIVSKRTARLPSDGKERVKRGEEAFISPRNKKKSHPLAGSGPRHVKVSRKKGPRTASAREEKRKSCRRWGKSSLCFLLGVG